MKANTSHIHIPCIIRTQPGQTVDFSKRYPRPHSTLLTACCSNSISSRIIFRWQDPCLPLIMDVFIFEAQNMSNKYTTKKEWFLIGPRCTRYTFCQNYKLPMSDCPACKRGGEGRSGGGGGKTLQ